MIYDVVMRLQFLKRLLKNHYSRASGIWMMIGSHRCDFQMLHGGDDGAAGRRQALPPRHRTDALLGAAAQQDVLRPGPNRPHFPLTWSPPTTRSNRQPATARLSPLRLHYILFHFILFFGLFVLFYASPSRRLGLRTNASAIYLYRKNQKRKTINNWKEERKEEKKEGGMIPTRMNNFWGGGGE